MLCSTITYPLSLLHTAAGIAQVVVSLLAPTIAATVDAAAQRGLEQLHIELRTQAQRISDKEEWISSLEDEAMANLGSQACISASNKDIWKN